MNSTDVIQMTLPALCFKGMVVLPNNEIRVELTRSDSARTIKEIMDTEDKLLVVLSKKHFISAPDIKTDFNDIAVIGKIIAHTETAGTRRLAIKTIVRCEVNSYMEYDPVIRVNVTTKPSYSTSQTKELACVRLLVQELDQNSKNLFKQNPDVIKKVSDGITPEILTDLFAHNLNLDFNKNCNICGLPSSATLIALLDSNI